MKYLNVPSYKILEGNLCTFPQHGITSHHTPRTKALFQHLDPFPQRPNLRSYIPTKTRPDPCPAPSGDPAPPPFVVFPGPSSEDEWPPNPSLPGPPQVRPSPLLIFPHTHSILSYLRVVPAVAAGPASERTLQNGDGRSSLGATGRFLARQLTHARVRAACLPSPSQERGDQSCGRTQLSAPVRGRGHVVTALQERRSARPQPRLANHCLGRGSRLARQKGSGSNHCLGKTVRPRGV